MRSPPKRQTRGRPAKNPESTAATSKPTKIVTAAAKARSAVPPSLTANTKSTAAKRKTRTDDADEEQQATLAKRPRGRPPKKPASEQDNDAAKPTATASAMASTGASRARVTVRKGNSEIAKEEPTAPKPTRGRPRKVVSKAEGSDNQPEPVKKPRGRPPTVMKSATTTTTVANKPPVKKVVKFREPDKENVEPAAAPQEAAPVGMRGRPARRGGAAATRTTTRPGAKPSKPQGGGKKPLSPKKITQLIHSQYDSEDELSLEKPLAKSPIKPPSKKSEIAAMTIEPETTTIAVNTAMFDPPELSATLFGSPARRPTSPPRDTIKSPAKRIAMPLPGSAIKLGNESVAQTPFKSSTLLQSAAKRPQSPMKPFIFSAQKEPASELTAKPSILQSPAKRAFPGFKSLSDTRQPDLPTLDESPVATPTRRAKSSQKLLIEEDAHEAEKDDDPFATPVINLRFSRSPSNEPSRHANLVSTEVEAEEEAEAEEEVEEEAEEEEAEEEEAEEEEAEEEAEAEDEVEEEEDVIEAVDEAEAQVEEEATSETEWEAENENKEDEDENEEEDQEQEQEQLQAIVIAEALEEAGEETEEEADDAAEDSIIVATEESNDVPTETEDRDADESENEGQDGDEDDSEDTMVLDDHITEEEEEEEYGNSSPKAESPAADTLHQLREKDLDPCHDMSSIAEDADDTLPFDRLAATPSFHEEKTPRTRSAMKGSRRSTLGFSSLSDQLGSWSAASPVKQAVSFAEEPQLSDAEEHEGDEDEIAENAEEQDLEEETMIIDEDTALARETNEMTLSDPMESEDTPNTRQSFDDSLSDASQEYGDENQVPVDSPLSVPEPQAAPVTPAGRPMTRSFNTTTKIPTKPADNSTPSPLKKKSFSASRAAPRRPSQSKRGAPVLSFSPEKQQPLRRSSRNISTISVSEDPEQRVEPSTPATKAKRGSKVETPEQSVGPSTPSVEPSTPEAKADLWSKIGTPARTPRKDLNSNLLRGAIVFVDVHTSEGADASGIFVELLTQMGARCLQKWSWNPNSTSNSESTKVGITHVVFKDGSKRTLEKVREANGVVQCVGVSWVLDCERDNEWLDESPYHIDTSYVPRGGARRRRSMEPKTVSNQNGSAVSGSPKERRESASSSSPKTPNRRQSSIWIHTPSDTSEEQEEKEEEDLEWSNLILTPVPKTPAPETLMKFATETPSNVEDEDEYEDEESPSLRREELMTRTCPPKAQRYMELGSGILSRDSDENVMVRLMAARRKSLQFAPKVGSPLAKMWQ